MISARGPQRRKLFYVGELSDNEDIFFFKDETEMNEWIKFLTQDLQNLKILHLHKSDKPS